MSEVRRLRGIYSALAYLPVVIPPVVAVLLWKTFYDGGPTGVFNTVLGWVGLGPYPWLQSEQSAMPSLVLESTWANAGATVIIYLAALTAVNSELYEAASVDGAALWRKVWHITMPQLRGVLLLTMILQIIGTAQVFLEPYLFTSGGPKNSTLTVLLLIYNYAFGNSLGGDYGGAAALSLMLAGFLAAVLARVPAPDALVEHRDDRDEGSQRDATDAAASSPPPSGAAPRQVAASARADAPASSGCSSSSASGRCSGSRSRRSRRRRTRSATRCRSSRTASRGTTWRAWTDVGVGRYSGTRSSLAIGSWSCRSSSRRPAASRSRCSGRDTGRSSTALLLATLFVPAVVLLVPLYIEIVASAAEPSLVHRQLLGDLAARRRERVQRRARRAVLRQPPARDLRGGARSTAPAPFRLFWSIALPMSKPILGVVSVFAVLASWKDFLWPLLVLTEPGQTAALRAAADDPVPDRARRLPRPRCSSHGSSRSSDS